MTDDMRLLLAFLFVFVLPFVVIATLMWFLLFKPWSDDIERRRQDLIRRRAQREGRAK